MEMINIKKIKTYIWFNPLKWRISINVFKQSWHKKIFSWRIEFLFFEIRKLVKNIEKKVEAKNCLNY